MKWQNFIYLILEKELNLDLDNVEEIRKSLIKQDEQKLNQYKDQNVINSYKNFINLILFTRLIILRIH